MTTNWQQPHRQDGESDQPPQDFMLDALHTTTLPVYLGMGPAHNIFGVHTTRTACITTFSLCLTSQLSMVTRG